MEYVYISYRAYFTVDQHVNKQNYRFWGKDRRDATIMKNLHPQKVLVWCVISSQGIFGPVVIDGHVTGEKYQELLEKEFLPFMVVMISKNHGFCMMGLGHIEPGMCSTSQEPLLMIELLVWTTLRSKVEGLIDRHFLQI